MKKDVERLCLGHLEKVLSPDEREGMELTRSTRHYRVELPAIRHTVTLPGTLGDTKWFLNWRTQVNRALHAKRAMLGSAA